ncbi:anhydro-N-acetylmuramic acid kinase [Sodalis sp.]|uniref:anhydro-N-acetylmuramic acid kinase n=1 Tax=Sodalis sp. (in: enterobacteria) TaxID=1898979 RepID=UPI003872B06F
MQHIFVYCLNLGRLEIHLARLSPIAAQDVQATLAELTARTIAQQALLCGGVNIRCSCGAC